MRNKLERFLNEDNQAHFQTILPILNVVMLSIIKQVALNKSSLLLRIDLQNTQTLQLN